MGGDAGRDWQHLVILYHKAKIEEGSVLDIGHFQIMEKAGSNLYGFLSKPQHGLIRWLLIPFLSYRGSRPGLFSDLSAGESCPLRIPLDKLGAAVSPTDKSRDRGPNEVGD
jgi:hypothetical protein